MSLIIAQSRLSASETHCRVRFDIIQRGWIPTNAEEEQPFDMVVDMGIVSNKREFQTIQVKSWTTLKTSSRPQSKRVIEKVSINGKERNSYWYYDQCIDWIATVNPKNNNVHYWSREIYQKKSPTELRNISPMEFPFNEAVCAYKKPSSIKQTNSSLSTLMMEAA